MNNNEIEDRFEYILIYLPLIQEIFKKPKTGIDYIFDYGIYKSAMSQKISNRNALKQVIYCYYRGGLTNSIKEQIEDLIEDGSIIVGFDDDYNGFDDTFFDPYEEISSLESYFENGNNSALLNEMIEFHKLRQVKDVLNMRFNIETVMWNYNEIQRTYNNFEKEPMLMVKRDMMFDYLENEKTEFDKVLFATYLGLRSLMGRNNSLIETTQDMIFCRAFGAKNKKTLESILKDKKIKAVYNKYNNRYQREKIIDTLEALNFISAKVGYNRRTYISFTLNYDEISKAISDKIKEKNINYKRKINKINQLNAKNMILQHLYK